MGGRFGAFSDGGSDGGSNRTSTPPFSAEDFGWALDIVHSRSFTVDAGPRGIRRYLVPFVDMLNHDEATGCEFVYNVDEELFLVCREGTSQVEVGQPLTLSYGPMSSEDLLLVYGFVPETPTQASLQASHTSLTHKPPKPQTSILPMCHNPPTLSMCTSRQLPPPPSLPTLTQFARAA